MKKFTWSLLGTIVLCAVTVFIFFKLCVPKNLDTEVTKTENYVSTIAAKNTEYTGNRSRSKWCTVLVDNGTQEQYKFILPEGRWKELPVGASVKLEMLYIKDVLYDVRYEGISCSNKINLRDNPVTQREAGYR